MISPLKTAALAAAICATSLVCVQSANADQFTTVYPSYDLYRLPNGSLAVNPGDVAANYGITAPAWAYGMTAPAYAYGMTVPAPVAPAPAAPAPAPAPAYGMTAPSHVYGITAPAAAAGPQPGSADWLRYCSDRYRTFNANTGTFTGYDGLQHFCR
jgi:BA14K-like protein